MQVSARILGQEYGLTAEEMNRVLLKLGFLEGTPGNYSLTDNTLKYAAQAVARAHADAEFLAKQAAEKAAVEAAERAALKTEQLIVKGKKAGKISLVVAGVIVVGYGIYSVTPKVKEWLDKRKHASEIAEDEVG